MHPGRYNFQCREFAFDLFQVSLSPPKNIQESFIPSKLQKSEYKITDFSRSGQECDLTSLGHIKKEHIMLLAETQNGSQVVPTLSKNFSQNSGQLEMNGENVIENFLILCCQKLQPQALKDHYFNSLCFLFSTQNHRDYTIQRIRK